MAAPIEVKAVLCAHGNLSNELLFRDATPENKDDFVRLPVWAFYLYHPGKNIHAMWDLGVFKDNNKHPPAYRSFISDNFKPEVPEDVAEILTRHGVPPSDINFIFISHMHFDHTGDVPKFPNATVVFGPGTQAFCRPAYPVNPDSHYNESTFPVGRTRELEDAEFTTSVGPWPKAYDFFGDGSVLLIDAPGHIVGHMIALVQTRKGRLLLGADSCHHCSHLTSFEKGGNMSYSMHEDEDLARVNLQRIDAFLKLEGNADVQLCLAHVGEHGDFETLYGYV